MTGQQGTPQRRVVAYERVSRSGGRTGDELERTTLREQRETYEGALLRGDELVARLTDVDQSGASETRPALDELWELVDAGAVDVVIVAYLSRFGRSASQVLANVERLKRAGVTFVSAKESVTIDPSVKNPYAVLMLSVLAAMAEIERERLQDGLASSNANAIADGVSIAVPYGYRRDDGAGSMLVPDRELVGQLSPADVVALIYARRLDQVGASAIARELNELDVPTPTTLAYERGERKSRGSSLWKHNTVRGIVATHTYKGVIPRWQYAGEGKQRKRVPDSLELLPARHDALVSDDDWRRAQFTGDTPAWTGKTAGSLLQGLVRCASCSQTMRPSSGTGGHKLKYECRGRARGCTKPARITRRLVDEYVVAEVERIIERGIFGRRVADRSLIESRLVDADARVAAARAELDAFIANASPVELGSTFGAFSRRFRSELDNAERERDALLRESEQQDDELTPELWASLSTAERRERLLDALDAVVVLPAPGRGRAGDVDERVHLIVDAPIELGGTGRIVPNRPFPLDVH